MTEQKKYKLTADTILHLGKTLHRIKALVSFGTVKAGDLGGYVEKDENLNHTGDARVCGNAEVFGDAEKSPINIIGLCYTITITDTHIKIGCEFHSFDEWFGFADARIVEMDGKRALEFWRQYRSTLMAICEAERGYSL